MTDKTRIIEIEIENYRQYNGKQVIEFPDRNEGFSVILGENGAGKSNILNAINWCFYKKEPHQKKNEGKYIINQQYMENLENGQDGTMSVKIKIQVGETEYHISRILTVTRNEFEYEERTHGKILEMAVIDGYALPKGTFVQHSQTSFEIMKKEKQDSVFRKVDGDQNAKMNYILPEILSPYFLLDGEYLEKFWDDLSRIKVGVEQISQLHLLTNTSKHLSEFETSVPKIGNSAIDSLTSEINTAEYWIKSCDKNGDPQWSKEMRYNYDPSVHKHENYHLSGEPRIEELQEDLKRMDNRLRELLAEFANSNVQQIEELAKKQKQIVEKFEENGPKLNQAKKKYLDTQINNGPLILLQKSFQNLDEKVEKLRIKGELPYEAKMRFTTERLEMNMCICHQDLTSKLDSKNKETNQYRKNVEEVKNQMSTNQGLDYALVMRDHFEHLILNDPEKFVQKNIVEIEENYIEIAKEAKKTMAELQDVRLQIQNAGGNSHTDELKKDFDYVVKTKEETQNLIHDIEDKVKEKRKSITVNRIEQNKQMRKDKKTRKIAFEANIWAHLSKIINQSLSSIKEEIRDEVQERTFEIFLETMYKKKEYDRFIIDEKYSAELYDTQFLPSLGSLSAGEKLFLALSFISALKEITGYKFPLVIDTPLGRVSARPRFLLSQALPKFLPGEQLLFLATGTEFIDPLVDWDDDPNQEGFPEIAFAQLLEKNIKMNYHSIRHSIDSKTATIQKFTPNWEKNNG